MIAIPLKVRSDVKFEGIYSLTVRDAETLRVKREIPPFKNLILDIGLDRYGTNDVIGYAHVGAGDAAPLVTQTGLIVPIARTGTLQSQSNDTRSVPPYYGRNVRTYRFAAGAAAGTIKEVGIGWANNNTTLYSRALVVDVNGNPTSLVVLADEVLDLTYELRMYPDMTEYSYVVDIGGTNYNILQRPSEVTSSYWYQYLSSGVSGLPSSSYYRLSTGPIGPVTDSPGGSWYYVASHTLAPYVAGSHKRQITGYWGLNNANNTMNALFVALATGAYQFGITPPLVKTNQQELSLTSETSWGRL